MTRQCSGTDYSLRPGGQLRSMSGPQLLFIWEIEPDDLCKLKPPEPLAVEDVRGELGISESCNKPGCMQGARSAIGMLLALCEIHVL